VDLTGLMARSQRAARAPSAGWRRMSYIPRDSELGPDGDSLN